ncbi:MAG: flagellar biosynthesis protein FlhB [Caulobacterales bacterium]|nr:flagellar biosynthesis protein FlhB [Caulobacterales bacterium]
MAEQPDDSQKTEEPTQRRLDEARKKGDVPKSMEIAGLFVLTAGAVIVIALSQPMANGLSYGLTGYFARPHEMDVTGPGLIHIARDTMRVAALVVGAPLAVLIIAALAGHFLQTGLIFSAEKIKPKLNKLSPLAGFKRLFGASGAANFGKGVAKLILVGVACFVAIWPRRDMLADLPMQPLAQAAATTRDATIALLFASLIVYALIAAIDFAGQKQSFMKRQRMSRQEIKDETKQSDGDPHVKARLRQIRMERARRRMMTAVPDATVVVANPTHFAVALKYEQGETPAPICVAKGVDLIALQIRKVAEEAGVPVVEDPPLARALHASVELDDPIPQEHFAAVAKIVGYVLTLARRPRRR